jgi:streptomycin 3"-adenylyltransferase
LVAILAEQIVGIYLHGSLAFGCFNPQRSDLDLLVVTQEALGLTHRRAVIELLLALSGQPAPIEISFLTLDQVRQWRYPTPYDLHFSEGWRESYVGDLKAGRWGTLAEGGRCDPDLAAHITVLRARGRRLAGDAIDGLFATVPAADYRASLGLDIADSLQEGAPNPVYAILNCCRTQAYLTEGLVLSKEEGGRWALPIVPEHLAPIVQRALQAYRSGAAVEPFDRTGLSDFIAYARKVLKSILPPSSGEP